MVTTVWGVSNTSQSQVPTAPSSPTLGTPLRTGMPAPASRAARPLALPRFLAAPWAPGGAAPAPRCCLAWPALAQVSARRRSCRSSPSLRGRPGRATCSRASMAAAPTPAGRASLPGKASPAPPILAWAPAVGPPHAPSPPLPRLSVLQLCWQPWWPWRDGAPLARRPAPCRLHPGSCRRRRGRRRCHSHGHGYGDGGGAAGEAEPGAEPVRRGKSPAVAEPGSRWLPLPCCDPPLSRRCRWVLGSPSAASSCPMLDPVALLA